MTLRPLPRPRLRELVPPLVHARALVALVPATADRAWAAACAWEVARAAASVETRRVALVDLGLDAPSLHDVVGVRPTEGIVDAFEYDVSLSKVVHEIDGVFFIGVGSDTTGGDALLAQPRWQRLQAGFRSEDALLLLYLSATALARLSAVPDAVIALAPKGIDAASTVAVALDSAAARGAPTLGVVRDRWSAPVAAPPAIPPRRRRTVHPATVAVSVAAMAVGGWVLLARSAEQDHPVAPTTPAEPAAAPTASPAPSPPPADTLPWTVQLAAYGTLEGALGHADALASEGELTLVAPVSLNATGPVWYRVLVGSFRLRDSAVAARADLWRRGAAQTGEGDLLQAPYSLVVDDSIAPDSLRHLGIPVTRWGDGRLLIGAFESPEQAALTEATLTRAGVRATLVTRTEPTS